MRPPMFRNRRRRAIDAAAGLVFAALLSACRFDGVPTGALPEAARPGDGAPSPASPLPAGRDMQATLRAWADYCSAGAADCDARPEVVMMTPRLWTLLRTVQHRVNAAHPFVAEPLGSDAWRTLLPGEPGDCEDLALTKRAQLIATGVPAGALRPATCRLRGTLFAPGDGHAVLTVETDLGTYVMGVEGDPVPWDASECDSWGYRWAGPTWESLRG